MATNRHRVWWPVPDVHLKEPPDRWYVHQHVGHVHIRGRTAVLAGIVQVYGLDEQVGRGNVTFSSNHRNSAAARADDLVVMVPEDVRRRFRAVLDGTGQIDGAALVYVQIRPFDDGDRKNFGRKGGQLHLEASDTITGRQAPIHDNTHANKNK